MKCVRLYETTSDGSLSLLLLEKHSKAVQEHLHRDHYQQHAHQALLCDKRTILREMVRREVLLQERSFAGTEGRSRGDP